MHCTHSRFQEFSPIIRSTIRCRITSLETRKSPTKRNKTVPVKCLSHFSHCRPLLVSTKCPTYLEFYPRPCPTRNMMHHRGFIAANLECDDATFSNGPFYKQVQQYQHVFQSKEKVKIGV